MALTINTNIVNDTDQYLLDAKNVKGGYVVVDNIAERDSLPVATRVEGTLCFCRADGKYYRYAGSSWLEDLNMNKKADKTTADEQSKNKYWKFDENGNLVFVELQMDDKLDINQGVANKKKYLKVNDLGYVEASDLDLIVTSLPTSGLDPSINYYIKEGDDYALYKAIGDPPSFHKVGGNDARVDDLVINVSTLSDKVTVLEPEVNKYDLSYDGKILKFVETNVSSGQVLQQKEINIISAAETTNTVVTITPVTKTPLVTTLDNIPNIEFTFTNTFAETAGGADTDDEINVIWRVDNTAVKSEKLKSKKDGVLITHTFPAANYISKGGQHSVLVTMTDAYGASASFAWKVNAVALSIDLTLDSITPHTGDIKFKYIPYGTVAKNITIQWKPITSKSYNRLATYSNITAHGEQLPKDSYVTLAKSKLAHGAYTIKAQCSAVVDGTTINSKAKYVDIIFVEKDNATPIIAWPDEDTGYKQYEEIKHHFAIYNPVESSTPVSLYIREPNTESYSLVSSKEISNSVLTEWTSLPLSYGDYGFKIVVGANTIDRTKIISVSKEPNFQIEKVTDNLVVDFNPQGRSNADAEKLWTSEDGKYNLTVNDGFDWYNGGWVTDEDGATAFCVKAGSRAYINFPLFRYHVGNGIYNLYQSFKFTFKTAHCRNFYAEAIKCGDDTDSTRLRIKAQNAYLYLANGETRIDYMEDEKLELDYIVDTSRNMVSAFINSDPSKLNTFSGVVTNSTEKYIEIGSDDCDVYLYRFKAFDRAIGYAEVLQNYVTDTPIGTEMKERYNKVNVWDLAKHTNETFAALPYTTQIKTLFESIDPKTNPITWVDYTKLANRNPDLRILIITCPRFTTDKDDKVEGCTVQQIMGDGQDPKHNWIATNVRVKGQGTSSNKYGMSGRNLDLEFNDGFKQYVNGVEGAAFSKYSMTNDSIGVKYFNVKVNIASSENANNACIAERYHSFDPYLTARRNSLTHMDVSKRNKVRDTMEFHPCVIFINETQKNHNGDYVAQNGEGDWIVLDPENESGRVSPVEGPLNTLHFYAAGDFGNSKKNHEVFGMDEDAYDEYLAAGKVLATKQDVINAINAQTSGKDEYIEFDGKQYKYPKECIVEIADNSTPAQFFKYNTKFTTQDIFDVLPTEVWEDSEDVEFRYPEALGDEMDDLEEDLGKEAAKETGLYYIAELAQEKLRNSARRLWQWVAQTDLESYQDGTKVKTQAEINALSNIAKQDYRIFKRDPITGDYLDASNAVITKPLTNNKGSRVAITVTYGDTTYSYDSKEYRMAKFKNEFTNYFVKDSALYYYLFTSRYQMIDNRAKNCFLHTADGLLWDLCFDYDNDTSLGIDNFGKLTLDYGTEDIDKFESVDEDGNSIITGRYNGYQSVLWCNIRDCFEDDLRKLYNDLEGSNNDGCWSAEKLCQQFETYQKAKPEGIQSLDMYNKYVRPATAGHYTIVDDTSIYIPMMNGRKTSQRRRFEKYQERYFGSKYYTNNTYKNAIVLRPTTSGKNGKFTLTITAYSKFYPNWSTQDYVKPTNAPHRITQEGETYNMEFDVQGVDFSSTVLNLLGGPCYADLGDLSFLTPSTATLNKGEKLRVVTLGNGASTYKNDKLTGVDLPDGVEELNIDNCLALTTLQLNGEGSSKKAYTQMKKLSAEMNYTGTSSVSTKGPTQIILPSNGLLEEAKLGYLDTLFGENLAKLHTLTVQGNALKNLKLLNCGDWGWVGDHSETYNEDFKNVLKNSAIGRSISDPGRVRLEGVNLKFDEEWDDEAELGEGAKLMDRVLSAKGYNEYGGEVNSGSNTLGWNGSYVSGRAHYKQIAEGAYDIYDSAWKDLTITCDEEIKQYLAKFVDDDGETVLYQAYFNVDEGKATVYEPVGGNRMVKPTKSPDEQNTYSWKRWLNTSNTAEPSTDTELEEGGTMVIKGDTTFKAVYVPTPRTYTITWNYNDGRTSSTVQTLDYGTQLVCPIEFNKYLSKESGTRFDLFKGWDKPLNTVKYDMTINAIWENGDVSGLTTDNIEPEKLTPAQIYTLTRTKSALGEWLQKKDRLTVSLGEYPAYTPINEGDPLDPFFCHDLAEKEHFFGDNPRIIDTELQLLDADKDWTLLIDGFMGEQFFQGGTTAAGTYGTNYPDGTLLSCQSNDSTGLRIAMDSKNLRVYWYGAYLTISARGNTTGKEYNRIVLRHKKGLDNNKLYVSYSRPDALTTTEYEIMSSQTITPIETPLILGGIKTASGYRSPAVGYIGTCKLWHSDIGPTEAIALATSPREDWKFSILNNQNDDGSLQSLYGGSYLDLWSDSPFMYSSAWGTNGKYPESTMQKHFEHFKEGFAPTWKLILKKQVIKYIDTEGLETPNEYNKNGSDKPADWVVTKDSFDYTNPGKYINSFETDIYAPAVSEIVSVWDLASKDQMNGKDDYLKKTYNVEGGTPASPGSLEVYKNMPYRLEGGPLQGEMIATAKWNKSYPSKRFGWFHKHYPSNTSWDTIQGENAQERWIYTQTTNPLKDSRNNIFDGCIWINTSDVGSVKNFYDNTFVYWNGKWHSLQHNYIWLRTKSAKDIITTPQYANHYSFNSAYAFGTGQGWIGFTGTYGISPAFSI